MFQLEIQTPMGWHRLARYERLEDARPACDRAVLSEKCVSRIVALMSDDHSLTQLADDGEVYKRFYNPRTDPDENWHDEYKIPEDGLMWQEAGF